jgi:lipopolysaccharide transport system ATP-binding protein
VATSPDIAVRAEGVSKRYVIDHAEKHDTLRDLLAHGARAWWRKWRQRSRQEEFWALRDVSFEIKRGEVVGIIGRNGAGKSTLLKILSRITEPTTGRVQLSGRVASLLEVGTGFHPELTGRENIFLNGAILGMSRAEIRRKFDEIVAFAEIERFLDTPVKRYSSGMYVRLAFAVAAHLEPEILIVDEVLAVGDARFQKKCLGKMHAVASAGRTVLFVSHNLGTVQSLCQRCVLLEAGQIAFAGEPSEAVARYARASADQAAAGVFAGTDPAVRVDRAEIVNAGDAPALDVSVTVRSARPRTLAVEFILTTAFGAPTAFAAAGTLDPGDLVVCAAGETRRRWQVDLGRIANGAYLLTTQLVEPMVQVWARHEHPAFLEVHRRPLPPAVRVLEQQWQSGAFELSMQRLE